MSPREERDAIHGCVIACVLIGKEDGVAGVNCLLFEVVDCCLLCVAAAANGDGEQNNNCRYGLLIFLKRWIVVYCCIAGILGRAEYQAQLPLHTASIQDNINLNNNRDYQSLHSTNHKQPKSKEKTYQSPLCVASRTQQHNNFQRRSY